MRSCSILGKLQHALIFLLPFLLRWQATLSSLIPRPLNRLADSVSKRMIALVQIPKYTSATLLQ
ncbi:hypothetical protein SAMN05216386_2512 [Nitrosospira briensis]|uniref:Uncharacterized protein n=1 Tax=Nitrosospira briensis TaxID=35799 RepID=A0A1I5E699_9PROT|nr:hypothetical protein SAMN05216386_2512 [Nitrosospira briensis]